MLVVRLIYLKTFLSHLPFAQLSKGQIYIPKLFFYKFWNYLFKKRFISSAICSVEQTWVGICGRAAKKRLP